MENHRAEYFRARARARRCAVQALYQWQLAGQNPKDILNEFVAERELIRVDMDYFRTLTQHIPSCIEDLRSGLEEVLDRDIEGLDPIERAILLIGIYELRHCPEIPWRVVINEGIELAKMFGATEGHKFVNGILDKLAKRLRTDEVTADGH